jgi:hypothetical protein
MPPHTEDPSMSGERDADDRTPSPATGPNADANANANGTADADGLGRRRLLWSLPAAMAGLAGCSGLLGGGGGGGGGGVGQTPAPGTAPPGGGESTDTTGGSASGGDPEPTATVTAADTPATETTVPGGDGVPTPTQTVAPRPPSDVILLDDSETSVSVFREEYYTTFEASVSLRNVGEVAVTRLAVRIDALYDPPGDPSPFVVASAYVDRNTFGEEGSDPLFSPGESVRMRLGRDDLRFRRDGSADASTDADDFHVAVVFRRVEYSRTDTPSPSPTGQ